MRTKNNKLFNFILEFSQVLLVFLGIYSALMCTVISLDLTFDRGLCTLIMLLASILFYGLFTVLETFRKGKLYGILGITVFFFLIGLRFFSAVRKGIVTMVNAFLKEFMNYTGTNLSLLSYSDSESLSVRFCVTLVLILVGVYLIAIVSAFFYRRRRSAVFIALTAPFVMLPLVVGRLGYFSNLFTYLIVAIAIVGTRHLRTDATDRRMRQKLSLLLMIIGLLSGAVSYVVMPPEKYERNENKIVETRNTVVALASWESGDVFTWFKTYFNGDSIDYGEIGNKKEITYTGETMLKISGSVNTEHGMYLKGYVGDVYEENKWSSLLENESYKADLQDLDSGGVTLDNWHVQLRNELGDSETSGAKGLWNTSLLRIRNIGFGYGNYLIPYLPAGAFKYEENGRSAIDTPGIDYIIEYYSVYPIVLRRDLLAGNYSLANAVFWKENKEERQRLTDFAKRHYLQVPDSLKQVCENFKAYLKQNEDLWQRLEQGRVSENELIKAVKEYIMKDTTYTLAPGKTPSGRDTVEYFLNESKKGYCVYYATAATILLRSIGIPARNAEGVYISKDKLADCTANHEIAVQDQDAHAWVEVYQENYGFVPLEVTPGIGEDEAGESDYVNDDLDEGKVSNPNNPSDKKDDKPNEKPEEVTPTPAVTEVPEEDMTFEDIDGNEDEPEEEIKPEQEQSRLSRILRIVLQVVIILLLILAVVEGQRRIRKRIFEKNLKTLRINRRIRMAYRHLAIVFFQKGVLYRGEPVAVYAAKIAKAMDMPEGEIYEFTALVYHARFGPEDITEEEMASFRIIYENIRRKAYENARILRKLYYMYIMVL